MTTVDMHHTRDSFPHIARQAEQSRIVGRCFSATLLVPALFTFGDHQYVVYHNENQRVTVAHRTLDSTQWQQRVLPLDAKWDNHRGRPSLAIDEDGLIHLCANMHAEPLIYWRSARPHDLETLKPVNTMTGSHEDKVTYPVFRRLKDGRLTFWYRHGGSGRSQERVNLWCPDQSRWVPLRDQPLFDGRGKAGAYTSGPYVDELGRFHCVFMWRQAPDVETNECLSYIWSEDLLTWRNVHGDGLALPVAPDAPGVIVDPAGPGAGLINMHFGAGFDNHHRPVIYYHKYDAQGNSQVFNARWESGRWLLHQTSHWPQRWNFAGRGAIPALIQIGPAEPAERGYLTQRFDHWCQGSGIWKLRESDLQPVEVMPADDSTLPPELQNVTSPFEHEDGSTLAVHWERDQGWGQDKSIRWMLRYESLPANRDAVRTGRLPEPSLLTLHASKRSESLM